MEMLKKYGQSLVALVLALVIIWFLLWQLESHFSGNVVGRGAGKIGSLASGQAYNFQG